jgi:hypothetical protein
LFGRYFRAFLTNWPDLPSSYPFKKQFSPLATADKTAEPPDAEEKEKCETKNDDY